MNNEFPTRMRKNFEQSLPARHPDADALNAYIERTLAEGEARQVLEHLSVCNECREVVYLASGAAEEPAVAAETVPARRLRWWKWAVPLAAVLVVGSVVFVVGSYEKREAQSLQYARIEKEQPIPAKTATSAEATETATLTEKQAAPPRREMNAAGKPKSLAAPKEELAGRADLAPSERDKLAYNAAPAPPTTAAIEQNQPLAKNKVAAGAAVSAPAAAPTPAAQIAPSAQTVTVEVNGEAPILQAEHADAMQKAMAAEPQSKNARTYAARKSVDSAKDLKQSPWMIAANGSLLHLQSGKWEQVSVVPEAHFTTVAVWGSNVWVGGKNLVLYHSADNGAHWERQTLQGNDDSDVQAIEVTSSRNLKVTTSAGQIFATGDGGSSWTAGQDPNQP